MGPGYRLGIHLATGDLWQHEQGPNGGDEMNVIRPGANYGWPFVSYGRTYAGPWQSKEFWPRLTNPPAPPQKIPVPPPNRLLLNQP
jgi:glucose/arabinose dehydrogenase